MGQAAAAVEQACKRVGEQRTSCCGSDDDLRRLHQLARQQVEQVLREAPDRRRMSKQRVRVDIDASMKAIAVVEVAIEHQHFELLQLFQRFLTILFTSVQRRPLDWSIRRFGDLAIDLAIANHQITKSTNNSIHWRRRCDHQRSWPQLPRAAAIRRTACSSTSTSSSPRRR